MIKKLQFTDYLPNRSKSLKFFLIGLVLSLPFWWGMNLLEKNLEDFLFWRQITKNPQVFTAQVNQLPPPPTEDIEHLRPIRQWEVEDIKIEAKAAVLSEIDNKGRQKVLFQKNSDQILPIASLTKLMTANIVLKYFDLSQVVEISKDAVAKEGEAGNLKIGEQFRAKDLLYPLLIESSNDAAQALAEVIGEKVFVRLMNIEAESLNLENTHFANPTGLDDPENFSTAEDLAKLTVSLLKKPLIWEILSLPEFDFYQPNGVFHHKLWNTNELLKESTGLTNWQNKIVGGKTGWTPQASGCFILVLKNPKDQGYLINVILGSRNRFEEMKKLIAWVQSAYHW